ncbi:uncharacterized protein LOC136089754 [Hydra vulgaris]|uniref:Uncharacterized protein LOC136089754 n=1 Tax=Hydra vulgaris TaxID=6087 RepID=A0ABM4DC02_HYDVU
MSLDQIIDGKNKYDNIEKTVKLVLEKLLTDVEANELPKIADKRKSYTLKEKVDALNHLNYGMLSRDVAKKYNVHKSMITRWKSKEKEIYNKYNENKKKALFRKCQRGDKHKALYNKLYDKFSEARKKGLKVNFEWLYVRANQIHLQQSPNADRLPKSIVTHFLRKNKIRMLCVQRKCQADVKKQTPILIKWHSNLREKSGSGKPTYDKKWGPVPPKKRINVDQIPLQFVVESKRTYEIPMSKGKERRDHRVWVAQPDSGLGKRQATLQICFSPEGMVKPALIFRGKGKSISHDEVLAYDTDVDVYWQPNAWADTAFSVKWVKNTLSNAVVNLDEYVLFCDNLTAQVSDEFLNEERQHKGIVWFGGPNGTHFWQPADAGPGKAFKSHIKAEQNIWLENDKNIELWLGNDDRKLSAKDRRILITRWVGEAYRKTSKDEKFLRMLYRSFAKTGCLITADSSEDDKISPEGMPACVAPCPLMLFHNLVEITETPIPDEVKDKPIDVLPDESDGEDEELDGQVEKSDGQEDEESGDEENKDPAEERNIFNLFFN